MAAGAPPGPSGPVLLERRVSDGDDVHADRVTEDGEVWRWSTVRARFAGGELVLRRGPASWERVGMLDAATLAGLRYAIAGSGARDLPPELVPPGAAIGAVDDTWTIAGRTVVARGAPTATAPSLEVLAEALDAAVGSLDP
jgi:hypothetical protein